MPTPSFTDIIKAYLEAQFGGDVPPIPGITVDSELSTTSENPVQNKVINAALQTKGTYSKPSGGIPAGDLASGVQTSLGKADSAYQKPSGGIPASDLASGVIPAVPFAVNVYKENESWHCSATPAQLVANAKNCYITVDGDDSGRYFPSMAEVAEDGSSAFLSCIIPLDSGGTGIWSFDLIAISWYDGDDVVVQIESIAASDNKPSAPGAASAGESWDYARGDHRHPKELPTVSSSDNGKFLRVVDGAWAAQAVPAAESASFGGA